jgi:hypothetical protein
MNVALKYRDRVDAAVMLPRINWREARNERRGQTDQEPEPLTASLEIVHRSAENADGNSRSAKKARRG